MGGSEPQQAGQEPAKRQELGQVGKIIVSAVALAILAPFVAILWAWAGTVVRAMGSGW